MPRRCCSSAFAPFTLTFVSGVYGQDRDPALPPPEPSSPWPHRNLFSSLYPLRPHHTASTRSVFPFHMGLWSVLKWRCYGIVTERSRRGCSFVSCVAGPIRELGLTVRPCSAVRFSVIRSRRM
ncbi:hypothetical protein R3P38DRAFT_3101624 [Favolaschia claudopus]|uniref:Secreted protein n=1 Tax=Favolaschia claudopus TaxID=2862362 RepID=A0AAV9ZMD2_9AGAR